MISIDPGVKYYACAYWDEQALVALRMAPIDEPIEPGEHELVLEKPQVYRHAKARNSDLVDLAVSAGRIAGQGRAGVHWYLPRVWKGQLPKVVHQARIAATLTAHEQIVLYGWKKGELKHLLDAIGLGLYHLGRLVP